MKTARIRIPALLLAVGLAVGSLSTTSCMKATTANIPGAVTNLDAQIYVAVSDASTAITEAQKKQDAYPAIKPILDNQIGPAFNRARAAGEAYHKALAAGQTPANGSAVLTQIKAVTSSVAEALRNAGVK